ncbi:MAG: TolC family outer membrane protein [Steroidobacteraceae bacterium]|nr:TolC family outer membrane protein [Steroidobacteraceae bacterium]
MHKKSSILAFGITLALLSASAWSADLMEVYQAAAKSDPQILEAQARRMAALEVKPQARGLLFPQVSATGSAARDNTRGSSTFPQAVDLDNNPATPPEIVNVNNTQTRNSDFWRYQAQATQTVFNWSQWQTLQRADSEVALAEANYRAAEQDLLVRVAGRYFDVLAAEDTLDAADATLQAVTRQLEQAEKRFEVGLIAITDVQEARAAHDNATAGVILAKRSLATAHEFLRELTGEDYQELVKPAENMPLDQPVPGDQATWVTKAETQNLDVIAARLGVDIAKTNVKIAESGHMPTVELYANYGQYSSDATQTNKVTGGTPVTGPADANQTQETYGVQVTVPIFSGGVTRSQVREQVYLHRASREKLEGALRGANRETRDAWFGVVAEKARVKALKQAVASNQTALDATEAGFEVGTRTTVDVLDARRRLFEAQRDYARSRYDYLVNVVRLKSAAGVLAPGDLSSINDFLTTLAPLQLPMAEQIPTP